jgi:predicted RNA-binding Zn-ribbon protein involved in translation (DUF1610 family)
MTSETRTTIQLSDIKAVEFECVRCHHRLVRPIGTWQTPVFACPECGETWASYRNTLDFLSKTASQLSRTASIDTPGNDSPFIVRLEIAQPKPKEQP